MNVLHAAKRASTGRASRLRGTQNNPHFTIATPYAYINLPLRTQKSVSQALLGVTTAVTAGVIGHYGWYSYESYLKSNMTTAFLHQGMKQDWIPALEIGQHPEVKLTFIEARGNSNNKVNCLADSTEAAKAAKAAEVAEGDAVKA